MSDPIFREHIPDQFKEVPYRRFAVGLRFDRQIYGGIPNKPELLRSWYATKLDEAEDVAQHGQAPDQLPTQEAGTIEEVASELDLDETVDQAINVFRRDKEGAFFPNALYLKNHMAKAMIKQSASLLKLTTSKRGSKQTLAEALTLFGKVTLSEDGEMCEYLTNEKVFMQPLRFDADGVEEFTGHISGPQGTRSIIKNSEFVKGCVVQFEFQVLDVRLGDHANAKDLTPQNLYEVISHGQWVGIGSNRSFDSGQFTVIQFEEITDNETTPVFVPQQVQEAVAAEAEDAPKIQRLLPMQSEKLKPNPHIRVLGDDPDDRFGNAMEFTAAKMIEESLKDAPVRRTTWKWINGVAIQTTTPPDSKKESNSIPISPSIGNHSAVPNN